MKQVSHLHGAISDLQWEPDGQAIAFLFVENATRRAGALDAMKPWNGVYGEDGVEVQRVAAVGSADGVFFYLTPPSLHVYEFTWGPNSERIGFIAAAPPGENTWWIAKLYTRNVQAPWRATGQPCPTKGDCLHLTSVLDPTTTPGPLHGLQIAVPRFSPDGKQIAFIGGIMSDQGSTGEMSTSFPQPASSQAKRRRTSPPTAPPPPPGSPGATTTLSSSPNTPAAAATSPRSTSTPARTFPPSISPSPNPSLPART